MAREPVFDLPAGPSRGFCAWADASVQFPPGSAEQEQLRDGIRERARLLQARSGELLHAIYAGPKHPRADIENVLLYNIDDGGAFRAAAPRGLRFEWLPGPVPMYRRHEWECWFGYRLADPDERFLHWRPGRELATWEGLELETVSGERKLERVWLALRRFGAEVNWPARAAGQEFAIDLRLTVPADSRPLGAELVKGLFDGVTCALQAHAGPELDELSAMLARRIPAPQDELRRLLVDDDQAVLGTSASLLHQRGGGVQWSPDDHLLVAGQLVFETNGAPPWRLSGRVFQAVRADWAQDYYMESG